MKLVLLLFVGLLFEVVTCDKTTNWKNIDDAAAAASNVIKTYPEPTFEVTQNILTVFSTYLNQLRKFADCKSLPILSESSVLLLNTIGLSKPKDSTVDILTDMKNKLPNIASELRHIVSNLSGSLGKLTIRVNNSISSLERAILQILHEFLKNYVKNLASGKQADIEPVLISSQELINTIARIAEAFLNSESVANDVFESLTVLTLILIYCLEIAQGTYALIGTSIYSSTKTLPDSFQATLQTLDPFIEGISNSIVDFNDDLVESVRTLLTNVIGLTASLNVILEGVFGLVSSVGEIVTNLSSGISLITQGLPNILG